MMSNTETTVLVVEDEPLIRMSAVSLLCSAGFLAVEAKNADEAISALERRTDIALVFTDVQMPGSMDGIKLCYRITDCWPTVKLLVVSGQSSITEQHLPVGARFLSKPYCNTSVVDAMTQLLAP